MSAQRDAWLQSRRGGLGGSDIAAVLGISPWRSPLDVYLDKTGAAEPQPDSEPMYWGRKLEDVVAAEFAVRTSRRVQRVNTMLRDAERPWMLANIDRALVALGARARLDAAGRLVGAAGILECKTVSAYAAQDWQGEDGSDALPVYYAAQGMWYLAVTGQDVCEFAALIGGQRFVVRRVERDADTIRGMVEQAEVFWRRHVLAVVPPDPRSADDAARLWRRDSGELRAIDDDTDLLVAINEYRMLRDNARDLEQQMVEIADELKLGIGPAAGLSIAGRPVCTWKAAKDCERTDWEAVARAAGASPELIAAHTSTKPGSRRFLLKD